MFLFVKEEGIGFPQNSNKYKNKDSKNQRTTTQFYFIIDLYVIFSHH